MKKIDINVSKYYSAYIGIGLLKKKIIVDCCEKLANKIVMIVDANLINLYGKPLVRQFKKRNIKVHLLSFVANESNKTREIKQQLENQMLRLGFNRDTCVIALGGGITTDISGFIASTYCRGVPVIYIPTSLLGMIDASIGGKTGVNTSYGKNLIGSFYQPTAIFSDIYALKTLPLAELKNGLAEAIKHAIITDRNLFQYLIENYDNILDYNVAVLENLVIKNSLIKKQLIEKDEYDNGFRQLLNFGHTIGHALEVAIGYKIRHGEAVAIGMVAESYISMKMGILKDALFFKIEQLINLFLPVRVTQSYSKDVAMKALVLDKKNQGEKPMFVLVKNIGQVYELKGRYVHAVAPVTINEALDYVSSEHSG